MFFDWEESKKWKSIERLTKGWSSDKKYRITTEAGETLLLRLSDGEKYEAKKQEYDMIARCAKLGFATSQPVGFGLCNGGKNVYTLLTWIEGKDLEEILPNLSKKEQYTLGRAAGKILKKIHSIPLEEKDFPNATKKEKKIRQLSLYEQSCVRIAGG